MNTHISLLTQKARELMQAELPLRWRRPPATPADPANVEPRNDWPEWDGKTFPVAEAHEDGWLCAEAMMPESLCGVTLDEGDVLVHIAGFVPFTLWIDGEEMFREDGNWYASGPIAEPLHRRMRPGERVRLVLRQRPTAMPVNAYPAKCVLQPRACLDVGVQVGAAAAQLRLAEALAETAEEKHIVAKAVAAVDREAIEANRWEPALASLAEMERILSPLSSKAKRHTVHLTGHTHIDLGWLWTWEDTVLCTLRDFKATADLLEDIPDLTFANSQVASFEILEEHAPELLERIKRLVASGRWENVAILWDDTDLNMVNGESLARQILYAADWNQRHFGQTPKVFWAVDVFGHPGNMPQIAKLAGAKAYFHTRCHPELRAQPDCRVWEGVDGATIPTLYTGYLSPLDPITVVNHVLRARRNGFRNTPIFWGIADHGGGMSRLQLNILAAYRDKPLIPSFAFSPPSAAIETMAAEQADPRRSHGGSHSQFPGCFTTHADVKCANRLCETALLNAEILAALASIDRRDALRQAWKSLFYIQFHDVLCGCSAREVYTEDVPPRARHALETAHNVADQAVQALAPKATGAEELALFNPLGFARTEPVRFPADEAVGTVIDGAGRRRPAQRLDDEIVCVVNELPAFAGTVLRLGPDDPGPGADSVAVTEEQGFFRIETEWGISFLEKCSGVITSHYDKRLNRELVHYAGSRVDSDVPVLSTRGMNLFQVLDCAPIGWSAWNIGDTLREENLVRGAEVELVDVGPVFARFRVHHHFRESSIREDILFYQHAPRIEFNVHVDWREPGDPKLGVPHLKLVFNSNMSAARVRSERPFSIEETPADGVERPMQTWVDVAGDEFGFLVLNDRTYGYDASGGRLRISLLRTAYDPDPCSDRGEYDMRFVWTPHTPDWPAAEMVKAGLAFNRPPMVLPGPCATMGTAPFLRLEGGSSVVCTALRRAEHADRLLLRFFETEGTSADVRIVVGRGVKSAVEADLRERPLADELPVSNGAVAVSFRPCEIKTLLIEVE